MSGLLQGAREKIEGLRRRINKHEQFHAVFSTPDGEQVLRQILKWGNATQSSFVAGDAHATAFREGQRHLAMTIARTVFRDTTELIKQIEKGLEDET